LSLVMLGQCAPEGCEPPPPPPPPPVELQVLSFNDYHGNLEPPGGGSSTLGAQLDPTGTPVGGAAYLSATCPRSGPA
jgi:5'-nucleotidase